MNRRSWCLNAQSFLGGPILVFPRDRYCCSGSLNNEATSIPNGLGSLERKIPMKCSPDAICKQRKSQSSVTNGYPYANQTTLCIFIQQLNASAIYLDITGMPHHIWMPLTKICIDSDIETNCIYVEPKSYTYNPTPKPGEFFDLSERIRGFSPIPTFAHLTAKRADEITLVPLLGFEGIRFRHLIERIQPSERDIAPVVGVPGFELEYPFHTFEGNASVLSATRAWQRVTFVDASCPFALFSHLSALKERTKDKHLQVATIGTKPHALGAMMYAMKNKDIELLYDHPIRKRHRSEGVAQCHLYRVSAFMDQV